MGFKPMVKVFGDPAYYPNGLVFTTAEDAKTWAEGLLQRWMQAEAFRIDEVEAQPNTRLIDGRLFDISTLVINPISNTTTKLQES